MSAKSQDLFDLIKFNEQGLVAVIAQDYQNDQVLMMAWMNRQSLTITLETGQMHYFSRSRQQLWHKGETSGHFQELKELLLDCDGDCLLAKVKQSGVACHTGRPSCFFNAVDRKGHITINKS